MKLLVMFAASAASAVLVLPTVTQAQGASVHATVIAAADTARAVVLQG